MASPIPSNINHLFTRGTFTETFLDDTIRSTMDIGPKKTRRRSTRTRSVLSGSITMNISEYTSFLAFYKGTLAGGSLPLEFSNPITGITSDYILDSSPSARDIGATNVSVSIKLEEQ